MKKLTYYLANGLSLLIPDFFYRMAARNILSTPQPLKIEERANYYNALQSQQCFEGDFDTTVSGFKKTGGATYYFDLKKVVRCFPKSYAFNYVSGDVTDVPEKPSFVKSRPIKGNNSNSVLLKLNEIRHYQFVNDKRRYLSKKDVMVWRGAGFRPNRRLLLEKYFEHPRCNVGRVDTKEPDQLHFVLPKLSITEQLEYKFILSLEGKDVATNLKWIMSSNSLCFTPKLRYETWFMEGLLEAGVHFVEVEDDFSDLIEKMDYYLAHPDEAEKIIRNANQWVEQFKDAKQERLLSLLVAKKYFEMSQSSKG